jgi:hypothetical protein
LLVSLLLLLLLLQVLADDETLADLCLSWHVQQKQHSRWTPVELQQHK